MNEIYNVACRFCGQMQFIDADHTLTEKETVHLAAMQCNCPDACAYQQKQESLTKAKAEFARMECADEVKDLLCAAASLCIEENIDGAVIKMNGTMKVGIGLNGKDKLVVSCVRTDAIKQEF